MMLLCGQSNRIWHYWAGRYPGKVGILVSPSYLTKVPIDYWMPFVLDNDAFVAWRDQKPWDENAWLRMLERIMGLGRAPRWAAVPDVVGDRLATLRSWEKYFPTVRALGFPTAFCAQDGMTPADVPEAADVVFIGGTDAWKFDALPKFTAAFPRVHCARVNAPAKIDLCRQLGCESIDGTGWFRDPSRPDKLPAIRRFIETGIATHGNEQIEH